MNKSKLIEILSTFTPSEIDQFKIFISSPYFTSQKSLIDFGNLILNAYPEFNDEVINDKITYQYLFPGQEFKLQTIHDLMNLMIGLIHKFLAIESLLTDEIDSNLRLMAELRKKNVGKEFLRAKKIVQKRLDSSKKDDKYYFNLMRYEDELRQYYINSKEQLSDATYLQNKSEALDLYYLASKLKMACNILNYQNVFSSQYSFSLLDEIMNYVSSNLEKFNNVPAIKIYYRILLSLTKPDENVHFYNLMSDLAINSDKFPDIELKDIYGFAQNYCIRKLNAGSVEYGNELFKIYRKLLETGIIFENGNLSQWDYKNITSISIRLNEFSWVERFIEENKDRILPVYREVAYNFNMANLYYAKKEFKKTSNMLMHFHDALGRIEDPNFDDTFYNLDSRTLLLKVYYESNDEDPFIAIIRSFRLFLERNRKISDRNRTIYLNLLKYTKKLGDIRAKIGFKSQKELTLSFDKLKYRIEAEQNIVSLPWLMGQVQELGGK